MKRISKATIMAAGLMLVFTCPARAALTLKDVFPDEADPFVGNYIGRWSEKEEVNPDVAAQVIALGGDTYRIVITNKIDMRCPILGEAEVKPKRGVLEFDTGNIRGRTDGKTMTGGRTEEMTFSMKKTEVKSPTLGLEAPEGAVVLFDGSNLDAWQGTEGWKILDDGTLLVTPEGDYLVSKASYTDVHLHVEFRTPYSPAARGQTRGNSGVFLQGTYEVQILDTFGLPGYYDECGALYKLSAPHVNACRPPLQWQTYDIYYRAPRYDSSGSLTEYGRMTVHQNGVLIHSNQQLTWITEWKEEGRLAPPPREPGPIKLQGHNNFIEFRNIWVVDQSGQN